MPGMSRELYRFYLICKDMERIGKPVPPDFIQWIARCLGVWEEMLSLYAEIERHENNAEG